MIRVDSNSMKRFSFLFVLALSFWICANLNAAMVDTFDTDLQGWYGDPVGEVTWGENDGNPGGYVLFTDGSGNSSMIEAPARYLGNWSTVGNAGYISFDHKIFDDGNNISYYIPYQVMISGPAGTALWEGETPTGLTEWTTITANIGDANWILSQGTEWDELLSNVTGLEIRIEVVSNWSGLGEIGGIDNITTNVVPIPAAAWLLGSGFIGLVVLRRKMIS